MVIFNFTNFNKFISLDLVHYFKSYQTKQKLEKEKEKYLMGGPTRQRVPVLPPDLVNVCQWPVISAVNFSQIEAPFDAASRPIRSPRAPPRFASPPLSDCTARSVNLLTGVELVRRCTSSFPAAMVCLRRSFRSPPLPLFLARPLMP